MTIDGETGLKTVATWKYVAQEIGFVLLGCWIFGGAVVYYLRFTMIFYHDNRGAIEGAAEALRATF